jgi:hypothetical protein
MLTTRGSLMVRWINTSDHPTGLPPSGRPSAGSCGQLSTGFIGYDIMKYIFSVTRLPILWETSL